MRHLKPSEAPNFAHQNRNLHESPRAYTPEVCPKTSSPADSLLVNSSPTAPSDTISEKRWKTTFIRTTEPSLAEADMWEELFEKVDEVVHSPTEANISEASFDDTTLNVHTDRLIQFAKHSTKQQ